MACLRPVMPHDDESHRNVKQEWDLHSLIPFPPQIEEASFLLWAPKHDTDCPRRVQAHNAPDTVKSFWQLWNEQRLTRNPSSTSIYLSLRATNVRRT